MSATGKAVRSGEVTPLTVVAHDRSHLRRALMPEKTVEETVGESNYVRLAEGLTDAMAHDEARRPRRRRTGSLSVSACRITWRRFWTANSARPARASGPIVPPWEQAAVRCRAAGAANGVRGGRITLSSDKFTNQTK